MVKSAYLFPHKVLVIRVSFIPFLNDYFGDSINTKFHISLHYLSPCSYEPSFRQSSFIWTLIVSFRAVSWLCGAQTLFKIISNSSTIQDKCWRWRASGPVGFCWSGVFSENHGGYRKERLWSGSLRNHHRTFGSCRIREWFSMYKSKRGLCFFLSKSL